MNEQKTKTGPTTVPPEFIAYMVANYPPDTVIFDPVWHAERIWRAAVRAMGDQRLGGDCWVKA